MLVGFIIISEMVFFNIYIKLFFLVYLMSISQYAFFFFLVLECATYHITLNNVKSIVVVVL